MKFRVVRYIPDVLIILGIMWIGSLSVSDPAYHVANDPLSFVKLEQEYARQRTGRMFAFGLIALGADIIWRRSQKK